MAHPVQADNPRVLGMFFTSYTPEKQNTPYDTRALLPQFPRSAYVRTSDKGTSNPTVSTSCRTGIPSSSPSPERRGKSVHRRRTRALVTAPTLVSVQTASSSDDSYPHLKTTSMTRPLRNCCTRKQRQPPSSELRFGVTSTGSQRCPRLSYGAFSTRRSRIPRETRPRHQHNSSASSQPTRTGIRRSRASPRNGHIRHHPRTSRHNSRLQPLPQTRTPSDPG